MFSHRHLATFICLSVFLSSCGESQVDRLASAESSDKQTESPSNARTDESLGVEAVSGTNLEPKDRTRSATSIAENRSITKTWLWSDPVTWGGTLPPIGANVVVPANTRIILDVETQKMGSLRIEGSLLVRDGVNTAINADEVFISGSLEAGSVNAPLKSQFRISLSGAMPADPKDPKSRGLVVENGKLLLYGSPPSTLWTKLNSHAEAGTQLLSPVEYVGWKRGDQLVIGPTDFHGTQETEYKSISNVNESGIATLMPLNSARWGRLQYLSGANLTQIAPAGFVPAKNGTPTTLDQRAPIGNLSRNIVIESVDDSLWQTAGFGAHVMVMGESSVSQIDGVEFRRVGQSGRLGRYPIHWHQLSYTPEGVLKAHSNLHKISRSSIWNSSNRCVAIHGTNGIIIERNICADIEGHALFLEDAVERKNIIKGNWITHVKFPKKPLLESDKPLNGSGSAGMWLSNPDNTVTGNQVSDSQGNGVWFAFPRTGLGSNKNVPIKPDRLAFGEFSKNSVHSNGRVGIQLDFAAINDKGETAPTTYIPTRDGSDTVDPTNKLRFAIKNIATWKNLGGGFWNRLSHADYVNWEVSDNTGTSMDGAVHYASIQKSLFVGTSLNARNTWRTIRWDPPTALSTYHSTADFVDNLFVNHEYVSGMSSGVLRMTDFYMRPVDMGFIRSSGNSFLNAAVGYRSAPLPTQNWSLAGAIHDPNGMVGPSGNFWTYDVPFLTHGATCQAVSPAGSNGTSCNAQYYGVQGFIVDGSNRFFPTMELKVRRYGAMNDLIDTWRVGSGVNSPMLANMRHFAAMKGGTFDIEFPGLIPQNESALAIDNAYRAEDSLLLALPFTGGSRANVVITASYDFRNPSPDPRITLQPIRLSTLAQVQDSLQSAYWQDVAGNKVWLKIKAPELLNTPPSSDQNSDENLYRYYYARVYK
jgi:G8 domain/Right handed beta helix region